MNKDIYSLLNSTENQDAEYGECLSDTEVNNIMKRFNENKETKVSVSKNKGKRIFLTLLAAAVAAASVTSSVYAYKKYKAGITQTAKYQNTVVIEGTSAAEIQNLSQEKQLMKYEFGWLPDGFVKPDNDWHYRNGDNAIASLFYRIPENKSTKINMPWSADCETYESDGKTAMINYRLSYMNGDDKNYGREIWVSFDGTGYLLCIYITDGISKEDTYKIIDNIKFLPTDEVCFSTYLPWEEKVSYVSNERPKAVDMDKCDIYHIGETIEYPGAANENAGYSVTINSAEVTDSFDGIHTNECGHETDYSELMDENGNIIENTRRWIILGDGVDTLDETVKEEKIPMHILKLDITYKNISDETNEIGICPNLIQIIDDVPIRLDYDKEYTVRNSVRTGDVDNHFSLDSEQKNSKNHVLLEPGESTDVQLAFFVADDELDSLYTYFRMEGNSLNFAMENGQCPVFDLRQ